MITFEYVSPLPTFPQDSSEGVTVSFRFDETGEASVSDVVEQFKRFLKAIGYPQNAVDSLLETEE